MWRMNLGARVRLANEEWRVHQQNRNIRKLRLYSATPGSGTTRIR